MNVDAIAIIHERGRICDSGRRWSSTYSIWCLDSDQFGRCFLSTRMQWFSPQIWETDMSHRDPVDCSVSPDLAVIN